MTDQTYAADIVLTGDTSFMCPAPSLQIDRHCSRCTALILDHEPFLVVRPPPDNAWYRYHLKCADLPASAP